MTDVKLPSGRMLSQWQNCDPARMEAMSKAAVRFALADAKTDILALTNRVAELESASQPGSVEAERKPIGYMNERAVSILAQGSVMCTHVSPTKTQFQQVAIYVEAIE